MRAYNGNGTSASSNTISLITVPTAPVATAATDIQATSFSANWNASTGATGYRLDVATDSGFTSFVNGYNDLDVSNVLTYSVSSNISPGTTYYYRVRAYNGNGTSASSNTISLATSGATLLTFNSKYVVTSSTAVTTTSDYFGGRHPGKPDIQFDRLQDGSCHLSGEQRLCAAMPITGMQNAINVDSTDRASQLGFACRHNTSHQ